MGRCGSLARLAERSVGVACGKASFEIDFDCSIGATGLTSCQVENGIAMVEFATRPLYLQVRDELWDRIVKGTWGPGAALPNEFLLAQELKVSIGTVRKAVDELVAEKAVSRQQGRGTFVLDRKSNQFRRDFDRLRNADGGAIDWRYLHLDVAVEIANDEERRKLRLLDPDAEVSRRG
jgi:DNA-binding GntR family transcriptional regulator